MQLSCAKARGTSFAERDSENRHAIPLARRWPGSRRPTVCWHTFPLASWPSRRSTLPRHRTPFQGHHGGEGSRRPTERLPRHPPGITAAMGLADLPSDCHAFPQARRRRGSPPYRSVPCFLTGAPWPSSARPSHSLLSLFISSAQREKTEEKSVQKARCLTKRYYL